MCCQSNIPCQYLLNLLLDSRLYSAGVALKGSPCIAVKGDNFGLCGFKLLASINIS